MLTKSDFQKAISDSIALYPAVAPLYQAGDPRILQHLDAMATMLAMLSAQVEVAMTEPFEKVRDSTILADASLRGIVRKGKPARVKILATNKGAADYSIPSGRTVFDSKGNPYVLQTSVTVLAGGTATLEALQYRETIVTHTVAGTQPFYAIQIPESDDETYLSSISVSDGVGSFEFRDRYVNTAVGERIFHVESDDRQKTYIRFGFDTVVGFQPADGDVITITIQYTAGTVTPLSGSPFSFDYILVAAESSIDLTMSAMMVPGQNPITMAVLKDLARYPSVYDSNAVFMGEFDFLVRRNFPDLQYLSVWNEAAEEVIRGANVDNINTLFVSCLSSDSSELVLTEANPLVPIAPTLIPDASLTGTQVKIKAAILAADDSYKVKFYTPVRSEIAVTISAKVSTSYVSTDVRQKIIDALIAEFGEVAAAARRGKNRPLYQRIYALLKEKVPQLAGGESDLTVAISEQPAMQYRPELWRYASLSSLTVTVNTASIITPSWG